GLDEAEHAKRCLERSGCCLVQCELDEIDTAAMCARRQLRQSLDRRSGPLPQLVKHHKERTLTVDCDVTRRSGSERVVEDFQGQEPIATGRLQGVHEGVDIELALPGKAAVMTAPGQVVHVELRCVRDLC